MFSPVLAHRRQAAPPLKYVTCTYVYIIVIAVKQGISKLAIRSVERGICPIAKSGVKYDRDVTIVRLDHSFL